MANERVLDQGEVSFSIEARIVRELGERLVKQPEVALLELIKNAHDADATSCRVVYSYPDFILVADNGQGMTLQEFKDGWMRIGTGFKENSATSRKYERQITGEKGIGRFAVRYLGRVLVLSSVAFDPERGFNTLLEATFNWPEFDLNEDLGRVRVPYRLTKATPGTGQGTELKITQLRRGAQNVNFGMVRTSALGTVSPYHALISGHPPDRSDDDDESAEDPGFTLSTQSGGDESDEVDVARAVLDNYVLRCVVKLTKTTKRVSLTVTTPDGERHLAINDAYPNTLGRVYADIRFFPVRKGTFAGMAVDGRTAKAWVRDRSGVAVFDRKFRVLPYGHEGDDWLNLAVDKSRSERNPKSSLAKKHLAMSDEVRSSTELNYMLMLPSSYQLVGAVRVEGRRGTDQDEDEEGLIAVADREGFLANQTFVELQDLIRGAVEAIAYVDRELQQKAEAERQRDLAAKLKAETRAAIRDIEANPNISRAEKAKIISRLVASEQLAGEHEALTRQREITLETMSMLGVVAGFMTHEFGTAIDHLKQAQDVLRRLSRRDAALKEAAEAVAFHIASLREFVTYTQGYIRGASSMPETPYPAKPRIQQVKRVFGKYADERSIEVTIDVPANTQAPFVPVSLYGGVLLNLYTNALKAVTAKATTGTAGTRQIAFRAWNEGDTHTLEVSDTGVGIPDTLKKRVFETMFTTTSSNRDPLGSGMGLGLPLIKRGIEAFGGKIELVQPPPGFTTCFRVRMPLDHQGG